RGVALRLAQRRAEALASAETRTLKRALYGEKATAIPAEKPMKKSHLLTVALGVVLSGASALSQSQPPTQGPAVDGSPAWFLQGSFPDPTGRTIADAGGHAPRTPP